MGKSYCQNQGKIIVVAQRTLRVGILSRCKEGTNGEDEVEGAE